LIETTTEIAEYTRESWFRGDLRHLLRPHAQREVYDFTKDWKKEHPNSIGPLVWNCHRAFGKSFELVCMCIERCLEKPHQDVKFGAPTYDQCKSIVSPIIETVLRSCPSELRPEKKGRRYEFRNPRWGSPDAFSVLTLVSCKDDADNQRGLRSDMVVLDECRDIPKFEYVVRAVFNFHFAGRRNPLFILSSTPPDSQDHSWSRVFAEQASRDDRYIKVSVEDDRDWTKRDDEALLDVCEGDREGTTWQREALCELVSDAGSLIVPEFQKAKDEIVVDEYERPSHYFPHMSVDFGFMDFTAALYGYVDFEEQMLIIEDEVVVNYRCTGDLASLMKAKEHHVFPKPPYRVRRFGDNDPQQLHDLRVEHEYPIQEAQKYGRESACARLRTLFQDRRIRIHSRCENLIRQLKNGVRNQKGDFVRSETLGHCDAIAALIYLNRMINWTLNPFPDGTGPDMANHFMPWNSRKIRTGNVTITHEPVVFTKQRVIAG